MRSLPTPPKGQFRKVNGRPRSRLDTPIGSEIPSKGTLLVVDSLIDAGRDGFQIPTPEPACAGEIDEEDMDATLSGEEDAEASPVEVEEEITIVAEPALATRKSVEASSKIEDLSGNTTPTEPKRRLSKEEMGQSWDMDEGGRGPGITIAQFKTKSPPHELASQDAQNSIHDENPERLKKSPEDTSCAQDTVEQRVNAFPTATEISCRSCEDQEQCAPFPPPHEAADNVTNATNMREGDKIIPNHDAQDELSATRGTSQSEAEICQPQLSEFENPERNLMESAGASRLGDLSRCEIAMPSAENVVKSPEGLPTESADVQQDGAVHAEEQPTEQATNGGAPEPSTDGSERETHAVALRKDDDDSNSDELLTAVRPMDESNDEMLPPKPKPCDVRADIVTFSTRLQMAKRDEESLRGVMLGDKEAAAIVHGLRKNSTITSLDLSDSSITPAAASVLASILGTESVPVPKLTKLVLARCPLGDAAAESLWTCLHRLPLDTLDMRSSLLSPVSGETLAASLMSAPLASLRALNLGANSLLSTGVAALAPALPLLSSLQTLFLDGNGIDDNGAEALATALAASPSLLALHLPNNEITLAGAQALVAAYRSRNGVRMRLLDLSRNRVGGEGAQALEKAGRPALRLDGRELSRQGSQGSFRLR